MQSGSTFVLRSAAILALAVLGACGRYLPPIPPEQLSPEVVRDLQIKPDPQGVGFSWTAPENDQRGKELKEMVGYRVYRKQLVHNADLIDKSIPYQLLTVVPDLHVEEREKLRQEAREANLPARRLDVGKEAKQFSFRDESAAAGSTYAYRIVPVNTAGGEGEVKQIIKIEYRGASSDITLITADQVGEEIFG